MSNRHKLAEGEGTMMSPSLIPVIPPEVREAARVLGLKPYEVWVINTCWRGFYLQRRAERIPEAWRWSAERMIKRGYLVRAASSAPYHWLLWAEMTDGGLNKLLSDAGIAKPEQPATWFVPMDHMQIGVSFFRAQQTERDAPRKKPRPVRKANRRIEPAPEPEAHKEDTPAKPIAPPPTAPAKPVARELFIGPPRPPFRIGQRHPPRSPAGMKQVDAPSRTS